MFIFWFSNLKEFISLLEEEVVEEIDFNDSLRYILHFGIALLIGIGTLDYREEEADNMK